MKSVLPELKIREELVDNVYPNTLTREQSDWLHEFLSEQITVREWADNFTAARKTAIHVPYQVLSTFVPADDVSSDEFEETINRIERMCNRKIAMCSLYAPPGMVEIEMRYIKAFIIHELIECVRTGVVKINHPYYPEIYTEYYTSISDIYELVRVYYRGE
jgi:hypothetical protein